jgi:hypothetical protein
VLPTPWLPLKKGQTLANFVDRDSSKGDGDAVVLTLRRRVNSVRKRGQAIVGNFTGKIQHPEQPPAPPEVAQDSSQLLVPPGDNNTQVVAIARPASSVSVASTSAGQPQQPQRTLSNRLSFDPATGIITLPDGEEYMARVAIDDSDSDYGEVSNETDSREGTSGHSTPDPEGAPEAAGAPTVGSRAKRFSTYFHHPERRRSQIPGAFPQ